MRYFQKIQNYRKPLYAAGLVIAFVIGMYVKPMLGLVVSSSSNPVANKPVGNSTSIGDSAVACKPGPWGELEYVPIVFSAPAELPTVQSMMDSPARWYFKDLSGDEYMRFINSLEMSKPHRELLLDPMYHERMAGGVMLSPPREIVLNLPSGAREKIFRLIGGYPENSGYFTFLLAEGVGERLKAAGVADETISQFKRMTCPHGRYLIFSGLQALLSTLGTNEERVGVVRALTEQKSVLIRLKITPQTDVDALVRYWDKAGDAIDTKALLQAMKGSSSGASIDLVKLLPPVPASLVYTFPKLHAPSTSSPVRRDCHWTAFNFFLDKADDGFGDSDYVEKRFMAEYQPVRGEPQYGDLIFLTKADGSIVHSCTYIADDITFTKNGATACHPWMFARIDDLIDLYSFSVGMNERVQVNYWRRKSS